MTTLMDTSSKKNSRGVKSEATLYVKHGKNDMLVASLYVDDLIFTENDEKMMHEFKNDMMIKIKLII
jgi:Reverse transcriptase (RNA-dependent DNA polymerase)